MKKVVIVDDENGARELLAKLIQQNFKELEIIDKCDGISSAFKSINKNKPDLVFLDIEMPMGTGFELLSKFDNINFDVIFVTAYNEYAIQAIKFSALDYILKPIDIDDLTQAVNKFLSQKSDSIDAKIEALLSNIDGAVKHKKIVIADSDGLVFLKPEEIVRCESDGNYTQIHLLNNKKITSSKTLGDYESFLVEQGFFRIHRSHIINLEHIKKFLKEDGGTILMSDDSKLEVSRRKKTEFLKLFTE